MEPWDLPLYPCKMCKNNHIACNICAEKIIENNYGKCFCGSKNEVIPFDHLYLLNHLNEINFEKYLNDLYIDLYFENIFEQKKYYENPCFNKYMKFFFGVKFQNLTYESYKYIKKHDIDIENLTNIEIKNEIRENMNKPKICVTFIKLLHRKDNINNFLKEIEFDENKNLINILIYNDLHHIIIDESDNNILHFILKNNIFSSDEIKKLLNSKKILQKYLSRRNESRLSPMDILIRKGISC